MSNATHRRTKRARFAPIAIGTGALAAILLSVTMSGSLAGFTASITNSTNNVSVGGLKMTETGLNAGGTSVTCNSTDTSVSSNAFTCTTINKYGGSTLIPGGTTTAGGTGVSTATVTIANTGTVGASSFTLAPGTCSQTTPSATTGSATNLCSKLFLVVNESINGGASTPVITSTALSLLSASYTLPAAPVGNSQVFTFTVTFPTTGSTATDNTYANLVASQQLVWTYNA